MLLCIKTKKLARRSTQLRKILLKILSQKYLTYTAMTPESFGFYYDTAQLGAVSFVRVTHLRLSPIDIEFIEEI